MRTILWILLLVVVLVAASVGVVWRSLTPPAPLAMPERGAVLEGVTVINPGVDRRENARVVIQDDRIVSIHASASASEGRYRGHYALPGLTDMHVHFPPPGLPGQSELFSFLFLFHGVTTVRDAGDIDGQSTAPARDGVAEGRFPGARVFACGPFVDGAEPSWANSEKVVAAGDGARAVERIADAGFDCIKIYNGLSAESINEIRAEARKHGLPLIGHVPRGVRYETARLDDVQHMIAVHPWVEDETIRFPRIMSAWQRLSEDHIQQVVATTLAHDIANTPTLVTNERLMRMSDYASLLDTPDVKLLPRYYSEVVWSPTEGIPGLRKNTEADYEVLRTSLAPRYRVIKRLHDAGARLHLGTDVQTAFVVPGISLHREMRLFEKAGLTPEQVWAIGTRGPARALGEDRLGQIAVGARADVLLFREDPTRSLDALDSLEAVVADGRLYTRDALDAQLASYQEWFNGGVYDTVATAIVRRVLANLFSEDD